MSSSAHLDNKNKDILVLGKGWTQGSEHTLTAEKILGLIYCDQRGILLKFVLQWSK